MSRSDSRLKKAETVLGARHECPCGLAGYYPDDGNAKPSSSCPTCDGHRAISGDYQPVEPGHGTGFSRNYVGWSKANPDKRVSVHVWPNGSIH